MNLESRIIISTGLAAAGKSTIMREICRRVDNSFIIDKDLFNRSILSVPVDPKPRLPDLKDYIARDNFEWDESKIRETPYGRLIYIIPNNDYYGRHGIVQWQLWIVSHARENLSLGKVPIIDCLTPPDYRRGNVEKLFKHPDLAGFPKFLVHFIAEPQDLFERLRSRFAEGHIETNTRDKQRGLDNFETFQRFITQEQPVIPPELEQLPHLLLNTSRLSIEDATEACLRYITQT